MPRRRQMHQLRFPLRRFLFPIIPLILLLYSSLHLSAALLRRANALGRCCTPLRTSRIHHLSTPPRIAMVTLSSDPGGGGGRRRSFRGVAAVLGGNNRAYATRRGYAYVNAGEEVDSGRPPSWSKILAVRSALPFHDWVFWHDADTVVTNPEISLEDILRGVIGHGEFNASPDLVVTEDINGVNAGVFFVRRSKWSLNFLDTWWNQTSFIRFGSTKSGDNDALKHLLTALPQEEGRDHVVISPMQCLFNSYPWFPSWKSAYRLISSPLTTWRGAYSSGDFMVHLAGIDEKEKWASRIVREMTSET